MFFCRPSSIKTQKSINYGRLNVKDVFTNLFKKQLKTVKEHLAKNPEQKRSFENLIYTLQRETSSVSEALSLEGRLKEIVDPTKDDEFDFKNFIKGLFYLSQHQDCFRTWFGVTSYTASMESVLNELGCQVVALQEKEHQLGVLVRALDQGNYFDAIQSIDKGAYIRPLHKYPLVQLKNSLQAKLAEKARPVPTILLYNKDNPRNPYGLRDGDIVVFSAPRKNNKTRLFSKMLANVQSVTAPTGTDTNVFGHRSDVHSGLIQIKIEGHCFIHHVSRRLEMRVFDANNVGNYPIYVFRMKNKELAQEFVQNSEQFILRSQGKTFFSLLNGLKLAGRVIANSRKELENALATRSPFTAEENAICSQFVIASLQAAIDQVVIENIASKNSSDALAKAENTDQKHDIILAKCAEFLKKIEKQNEDELTEKELDLLTQELKELTQELENTEEELDENFDGADKCIKQESLIMAGNEDAIQRIDTTKLPENYDALLQHMPLQRESSMTRQLTDFLRKSSLYEAFFIPHLGNKTDYNPKPIIDRLIEKYYYQEPQNSGYIYMLHYYISTRLKQNPDNLVAIIREAREIEKSFGIKSSALDKIILKLKRHLGYLPEWFDERTTMPNKNEVHTEEQRNKLLNEWIDSYIEKQLPQILSSQNLRTIKKIESKKQKIREKSAQVTEAQDLKTKYKEMNELINFIYQQ